MTTDILWLNMNFFNHSSLFMLVTQLEYSLLQLTLQVDELIVAKQHNFKETAHTNHRPKYFTQYFQKYFLVFTWRS